MATTRRTGPQSKRRIPAEHDTTENEEDVSGSSAEYDVEEDQEEEEEQGHDEVNEDGADESTPLLPIFSAAHLGAYFVLCLSRVGIFVLKIFIQEH